MAKQLVRYAMNPEVPSLNNFFGIAISPNSRMVIMYNRNSGIAMAVWLRDANNVYQQITGQPFIESNGMAEFTADGQYLITSSANTARRVQVWSVNYTTGLMTLVNSITSTVLPIQSDGTLIRLSGDYFVTWLGFNAAGTMYVLKLDRTTSPVSVVQVASFPVTDVNLAFDGQAAVIPGKNALVVGRRLDSTGNRNIAIMKFDPTAGTLTQTAAASSGTAVSTSGYAVSDDGLHYIMQGATTAANARHGAIAADLSSITAVAFPTAFAGLTRTPVFLLNNSISFYGAVSGTQPLDKYIKWTPAYVPSDNDGEVLPATPQPALSFSNRDQKTQVQKALEFPNIFAVRHASTSDTTLPGVSVYRAIVENTQLNLLATGPMGDAFAAMQRHETTNFVDSGPMGDAFASVEPFRTADLYAIGPMGDAFVRASDQSIVAFDTGPMGDAFAQVLVDDSVNMIAVGPMGDALSIVQVNDEYSFVGIGPIADAFATFSDERVSFEALGPMGDAFTRLSDERLTFAGLGPMGDAWANATVHDSADLFATAPMGDAFFETKEEVIDSLLFATGPMGDALATTTNSFLKGVALGPMGDAGIGLSSIPRGCRRRSMMVLNVL